MPETFSRDAFADVVGSTFQLPAPDDKILALDLIEVSEVRRSSFQESFDITFLLQEGYNAPQGVYDLSHEKLGPMQLLLVPIGIEDGRLKLEAVFNLLINEKADG